MEQMQLLIDFNKPEPTNDEESALNCFQLHHPNLEKCDCLISWWNWEEQTKRSIWEVV